MYDKQTKQGGNDESGTTATQIQPPVINLPKGGGAIKGKNVPYYFVLLG
jgi:hypothetical protein